jgi:drug/metabolite transporter (DMT)-like permease
LSWAAFGAVIFWEFSFIATKVALKEVHPFTLLTLRYAIGVLLLLLVQYGRDKVFLKAVSYRDWIYILLSAAVGVLGLSLLQSYGLLYTPVIDTGSIVVINPIFIALAARLFLGEAITLRYSLFRFAFTFGDLLILASPLAWTTFTIEHFDRGMEQTSPYVSFHMDGYLLFGNLLFWSGSPFWVFNSGENRFQRCRNVPLSGTLCYSGRRLSILGWRDSLDHTYGRGNDPGRSPLGNKKLQEIKVLTSSWISGIQCP